MPAIHDALNNAIDAKVAKAAKPRASRAAVAAATVVEVTPLQAVINAAFSSASSDETLRLAFVAAGGNQDEPRKALICGRLMFSLKYTQEQALRALAKDGNPKHNPEHKDDVRTIAEEKAYGAARVYLSGKLRTWGLKTGSTQGGDRSKSTDAMDTEKLVMPGKPKVSNVTDLAAYAVANAKATYDLYLLNKAHSALANDLGAELMGAASDYLDAVRDIVAKHTK